MSRCTRTSLARVAAILAALVAGAAIDSFHRAVAQAPPVAAPAARTWQIQVDNVSPEGHNWSFNAYYPSHLQVHAGDNLVFTVAKNPNAFHTATLLGVFGVSGTPAQNYPGFVYTDEDAPDALQTTYFSTKPNFGLQPKKPCGRGDLAPCIFDVQGALKSGVLISPPPGSGGQGNPSFTETIDPTVPPGTYYFVCLVHGPSMSGSVDVLPPEQPAQRPEVLAADAGREYAADLLKLAAIERDLRTPGLKTTLDGQREWSLPAGGGSPDPRLSVNSFGVNELIIRQGDTVTWTNQSPPIVAHTVTGFATEPGQQPPRLSPFQPVCGGIDPNFGGETEPDVAAAPGVFPTDIWNTCQVREENHITEYALASAPSGSAYTGGSITSGILLPAEFLSSPIAAGLPYLSRYSIAFPQPGTYQYTCAIHYGMVGTIVVQKTQ